MASGFAIDAHLVITAAHVARGANTISVKSDSGIGGAKVIAFDMGTDTALLRTDSSCAGRSLQLTKSPLDEGADLAVLGYPLGANDLRISDGIVSGLDNPVTYPPTDRAPGYTVDHVFITNAATNGGNSGGPVIDQQGQVIGLVSGGRVWDGSVDNPVPVQGTNYIIPAGSIRDRYAAWKHLPISTAVTCRQGHDNPPVTGDAVLGVEVTSAQQDASDIAQALFLHGSSINTGDYASAWSVFTSHMQRTMGSLSAWKARLSTSYWTHISVDSVTRSGHVATARTQLRTRQESSDGHNGQTCSDWTMRYHMKLVDGVWLIDQVKSAPGSPTSC